MAGKLRKTGANAADFNAVVAEVEAERNAAPVMSPIEDEYEMVAGYTDENGTIHKTFEIRAMTGADEEYLARFQNSSAAKLIPTVLERCVERIDTIVKADTPKKKWRDIIDSLYVADQDYIMLRIRETSIGETLEARHKCPECGNVIVSNMGVDDINLIPWDGEEGIPFELHTGIKDKDGHVHTTGIIRYPRGKDRVAVVPIAAKNAARGRTLMLARLTVFDGDMQADEYALKQMTVGDRNYLQRLLNENQFGLDLSIEIECPECGNTFDGTIGVANFI